MVFVASHCHWAQIDDAVIILDGHRGQYFALQAAEALAWCRAVGDPTSDPQRDPTLAKIVGMAIGMGWIETSAKSHLPPRRAKTGSPSVARAAYCLVRSELLLRLKGFKAAYGWASGVNCGVSVGGDNLTPAIRSFGKAEHFFFSHLGLEDCLPRSLALYAFLAGAGFSVAHRIGVRRYPFAAHAWVENHGVAILEVPGVTESYTVISTLTAANAE
jgi:hypothetical protein